MATQVKLRDVPTVEDALNYEAWRQALLAFYRTDCWFQSAANVERGDRLTAQDKRLIEVLQTALEFAPAAMRKAA